jgi:hypothetical protein
MGAERYITAGVPRVMSLKRSPGHVNALGRKGDGLQVAGLAAIERRRGPSWKSLHHCPAVGWTIVPTLARKATRNPMAGLRNRLNANNHE